MQPPRRHIANKVRVPDINDISDTRKATLLLHQYGYGITSFSGAGVGIYSFSSLDDDGSLPVDAWIFYTKREFIPFMEALQKLQEAEKKLAAYAKYLPRMGL